MKLIEHLLRHNGFFANVLEEKVTGRLGQPYFSDT